MKILKNRGVSLVEITIALAITAYIVLGFARLFMQSTAALNSARMQTLAHNWAADKMEDIKTRYYVAVDTGTWTPETEVLAENVIFTRDVSVVEEPPGLKEIAVTVSWSELGNPREISVVSYMAEY